MPDYIPFIIAAVIVIALLLLLQTRYKKQVAGMLLYLVAQAEKELGPKTGQLKYSAVTTWLYERLPTTAKIFLSPQTIDTLIEEAVQQLKAYLEANKEAKAIVAGTEVPE